VPRRGAPLTGFFSFLFSGEKLRMSLDGLLRIYDMDMDGYGYETGPQVFLLYTYM
jgi:hypothetical protein